MAFKKISSSNAVSVGLTRRVALQRVSAMGLLLNAGALVSACASQAVAPSSSGGEESEIAFYGIHQAGITTPRPTDGLVVSFKVQADDVQELEALLRDLSFACAQLMRGSSQISAQEPVSASAGILAQTFDPQDLTITVSLGSSLFDDRPWLLPHKPAKLQPMMAFLNDELNPALCHGDLSLQICANNSDAVLHALRLMAHAFDARMRILWLQQGQASAPEVHASGRLHSGRNHLGFRDGSANPDVNDVALMNRVVWVSEANGEPAWTYGGSYQAVRIIRNMVVQWDYLPVEMQEAIMGRAKTTGAPLDQRDATEFDEPNFVTDADGSATALNSHVRLSNPRTPESQANLMLRRSFNYNNGLTQDGLLDQGLLFICYQADLERSFIEVQKRLDGEPLEAFVKPIGGGFFFSLPGAANEETYLGAQLIEAIKRARIA